MSPLNVTQVGCPTTCPIGTSNLKILFRSFVSPRTTKLRDLCHHTGMKKIQFDSNGIYASDARLSAIALECLEQERRERACLRAARAEGIQWTDWHISDRD